YAPAPGLTTLPRMPFLAVTLVGGIAALLAAVWPQRRIAFLAAPALMLALVVVRVQQVQAESGRRAPFQRDEMLDARANIQKLLPPGSVVITTEDVGRPAEDIESYSGVAHAMYLTDLARWRLALPTTAASLILDRQRPYLYIPAKEPGKDEMLASLRKVFQVDLVAAIPPQRAMAHFVAAPFHRGVAMELYAISAPWAEKLLRERDAGAAPEPPS